MACPDVARDYYDLPQDATYRDMILAVRADEACHRELNHHFADLPSYADVDSHNIELKPKGMENKDESFEVKFLPLDDDEKS